MSRQIRNKPYYSLGKIKEAIKRKKYEIDENVLQDARDCFGWQLEDIEKAFLRLKQKDFSNSKPYGKNPKLWVDNYRAKDLMGEKVYTHIHFEDEILIIGSLKTL